MKMSENLIIKSKKQTFVPQISVPELLWNQLNQLQRESICVIDANSDRKLTANELMSKSNAFAKALIDRGVNKSDIILTFAENTIEHVIALFGTAFMGTTVYPITYIANIYEMETLLETLESLVIITSISKSQMIEKVIKNNPKINVKLVIVLDGVYKNYLTFNQLIEEGVNRCLDRIPYFNVDPKKDVFIMLQSSGTTGVPKSILHSHYSYSYCMNGMSHTFQSMSNLIFGHLTPFGSATGTIFIYGYICVGMTVVIYRQFSEELLFQSIEKNKINLLFTVPVLGSRLLSGPLVDKYDLSSLKLIFTAGAAFPGCVGEGLINKYKVLFKEAYGMSEFGALTDPMDHDHFVPGCLGGPGYNSEVKIRDIITGNSLGPNMEGEICIRGPSMFMGYLNNPLATKETIDSEGWLRTGDIGHYDQNERLFITDRLKELIKFGTKQVSPTEVEQFLLTHPCVTDAAVVGVRHQTDSQWPRAYVRVKDNMNVTEEELKKYVLENLNEAKQLRAGIIFVDSIPRIITGKIDRKYFKRLIENEVIVD